MYDFKCPGCSVEIKSKSMTFDCDSCHGKFVIYPWPTQCEIHLVHMDKGVSIQCGEHGIVIAKENGATAPLENILEKVQLHMQGITSTLIHSRVMAYER